MTPGTEAPAELVAQAASQGLSAVALTDHDSTAGWADASAAARAHGIGTATDLADYYRIGVADTKRALAGLVDDGRVVEAAVAGWREPAYLHRDARVPRAVAGAALLSPFDPLVWRRERTERIFGFHYRIEIYTPAPKRIYGYYSLPILLDDAVEPGAYVTGAVLPVDGGIATTL